MTEFDSFKALRAASAKDLVATEMLRTRDFLRTVGAGAELGATQKLMREMDTVRRAKNELEAVKRVTDDFKTLKVAQNFLAEEKRLMQAMRIQPQDRVHWAEYAKVSALGATMKDQFRAPEAEQLRRMLEQPVGGAFRQILEDQKRQEEWLRRIGSLASPWARIQHEQRSFGAVLKLAGIGEGLRALAAFRSCVHGNTSGWTWGLASGARAVRAGLPVTASARGVLRAAGVRCVADGLSGRLFRRNSRGL